MMKWLRKYTKQIMVAVVLLAMFSFVGGSALVQILSPDSSGIPRGQIFGKEYTQGDLDGVLRNVAILDKMFYQWKYVGENGPISAPHWFMLAKEAEHAGIGVSDEEVDRAIEQQEAALQRQAPGFNLLERMRRDNIPAGSVRDAIRQARLVEKHASRALIAALPSEPEIREYVHEIGDKVQVRFISLPAEKFVAEGSDVTEADAMAFFEAHKDVSPDESDDGFGYKYDRRVRLQYLYANIDEVQKFIEPSFEDVKEFWKNNREKYKITETVQEPAPATSQPTTQPAPTITRTKERTKTFSEARPDVERELRLQYAERRVMQALRKANQQLLEPWSVLQPDEETGFRPVPAGVDQSGDLSEMAASLSREFDVQISAGLTEPLSQEALQTDAQLGALRTSTGLPLAAYAFRLPGWHEDSEAARGDLRLQMYEPCDSPLTQIQQSFTAADPTQRVSAAAVFRVVEMREAESPQSIDEVKEQVVKDVRLSRAFASIEPLANEFFAAARRIGVEAALQLFDDLKEKLELGNARTAPAFARRNDNGQYFGGDVDLTPPFVVGVGQSEAFVDGCFELTADDWTPPQVPEPESDRVARATTQPAPIEAPKVRIIRAPEMQSWYVVELLRSEPLDRVNYQAKNRSAALNRLGYTRQQELRRNWFDTKRIEERCQYKPMEGSSNEDEDTDDAGGDAVASNQ